MTDRKIHRLTAIPTPWGNGTHLVLPKEWATKRIYCVLQEEWDSIQNELKMAKVKVEEVTAD